MLTKLSQLINTMNQEAVVYDLWSNKPIDSLDGWVLSHEGVMYEFVRAIKLNSGDCQHCAIASACANADNSLPFALISSDGTQFKLLVCSDYELRVVPELNNRDVLTLQVLV